MGGGGIHINNKITFSSLFSKINPISVNGPTYNYFWVNLIQNKISGLIYNILNYIPAIYLNLFRNVVASNIPSKAIGLAIIIKQERFICYEKHKKTREILTLKQLNKTPKLRADKCETQWWTSCYKNLYG